jgi:hypothetical protein
MSAAKCVMRCKQKYQFFVRGMLPLLATVTLYVTHSGIKVYKRKKGKSGNEDSILTA